MCPWWVSWECSQSSGPESGEQGGSPLCSATHQLGDLGRPPSSRLLFHLQQERLGSVAPGCTGQPLISTWGYVTGREQGELGYQAFTKTTSSTESLGRGRDGLGISNQSVINNRTAAQGGNSVQSPFKIPGLGVCLGSHSGDCAFGLPPLPRLPLPSSGLTAL